MSINDKDGSYYKTMRKRLFPLLKKIKIQEYKLPKNFINKHPNTLNFIKNGISAPWNQLSMYYNDKKAFELAKNYSRSKNFKYDIFLKMRSDIMLQDKISFKKVNNKENRIFSVIQITFMKCPIVNVKDKCLDLSKWIYWVSDAIAYGNEISMQKYTSTIDFVLSMNDLFDYPINFEPCLTQSLYHHRVKISYFKTKYFLDRNRRVFDFDLKDPRDKIKLSEFRHLKSSNFILKMYKKFNERIRRKLELHRT